MRNLLVTITNAPHGYGGVSAWIERITEALPKYGWCVITLTHALDEKHLVDWRSNHPKMVIKPLYGRFARLSDVDPYLGQYLDEVKPDVVAISYSFWMIPTLQERKRRGHPLRVIGCCHQDGDAAYSGLSYYRHCFDHVLCFGSKTYEKLLAIGYATDEVTLVPHGVPCPEVMPTRTYQGKIRLAYVGRLVQEQKRILDFVPLVRALNVRGLDYRLDFYGSGPDEDELRKRIRAVDEGKVVFHGWLPAERVASIAWPQADICVHLSEYEVGGAPLSVLEAMAYGAVPIVTRISGIEHTVRTGETGYTFEVGDIERCADLIVSLDRDRDKLAAMSQRAWALIQQEHSIQAHAYRLAEVLHTVLERPARLAPAGYMGVTAHPLVRLLPGPAIVYARRMLKRGSAINEGYTTLP